MVPERATSAGLEWLEGDQDSGPSWAAISTGGPGGPIVVVVDTVVGDVVVDTVVVGSTVLVVVVGGTVVVVGGTVVGRGALVVVVGGLVVVVGGAVVVVGGRVVVVGGLVVVVVCGAVGRVVRRGVVEPGGVRRKRAGRGMSTSERAGPGSIGRKTTDTGRGFSTVGEGPSDSAGSPASVPAVAVMVEVVVCSGTVKRGRLGGGEGREAVVVVVDGPRTTSPAGPGPVGP